VLIELSNLSGIHWAILDRPSGAELQFFRHIKEETKDGTLAHVITVYQPDPLQ
jgi:hypothetical protein